MSRFVVLATVLAMATPASAGAFLAPLVKHSLAPGGGKPVAPVAAPTAVLVDVTGPAAKIDLPQLLQVAIRQAPQLASATLDVEIAAAQVEQSLSLEDWSLKAQVSVQNSLGFGFTGITTSRRIDGSASIGRELSTGGTVGIGVSTSYFHSHSPADPANMIPAFDTGGYTDAVDLSLTQPLLRGRGRAVAYALQIENALLEDASALTRRQDAINIVENVVTGYWDLVADQRALEIAQGSLDLAKERLRVTQIGVSGGKVADSELLAVEEAIQTRQEDVINAEVAIIQQSLFLRRTIGMEIGPNQIGLDAGAELSIPERTWDLADLLNQAEHSSPQLASLAKQEQNATIVVEVTENGLLPQLDFSLAIGPDGSGASETEALKELAKASGLFVQGSLTFSQSIGRHQVYGQERQYRAQREKIRVNANDIRLQIAQAMATAVAQVRAAEQRVAADSKAVELAQKNILVEQSRFELGKSTNFDVLLRQDELRQAQLREARAQVDWHKAQAVIAALTGTLLADYGIELR